MGQLFAVVYDSPEAARRAADRLRDLARGQTISLRDLVVVTRNADGRVDLEQSIGLVLGGALGGAFWGGLVGLIFLAPLAGAAGGAAAGAIGGWLTDYGIDDAFMKAVAARVTPGKAALFVLAAAMTPEKVAPVLAVEPGALLYSSLSPDVDAILTEALQHPDAAVPAEASAVEAAPVPTAAMGGR